MWSLNVGGSGWGSSKALSGLDWLIAISIVREKEKEKEKGRDTAPERRGEERRGEEPMRGSGEREGKGATFVEASDSCCKTVS
jgi:hypothetical protein